MTGPEHYAEAERLLAFIEDAELATEVVIAEAAIAQVHATLALAAATAEKRVHTPEQEWGGTETFLDTNSRWERVILP